MTYSYPACFYKERSGDYSVIFPELNIATCGNTLDEAAAMAKDCLSGHLYYLMTEGKEIPKPIDAKEIDVNKYWEEYDSAFVCTIEAECSVGK